MELKDKNIILTGASSGIGYALAKKLANEKCNLALASRRIEVLENLAGELRKFGNDIIAVKCDVGKKEDVKEAILNIKNHFGKIDIAIFNSGISYRGAINSNEDKYEQIIKVNLLGLIYCIEEVGRGRLRGNRRVGGASQGHFMAAGCLEHRIDRRLGYARAEHRSEYRHGVDRSLHPPR